MNARRLQIASVLLLAIELRCQAPNDECSNAWHANLGVWPSLTNVNATTSSPTWTCGLGANDVWFWYVAPQNGNLTIDTCGANTNFDTTLEAFTSPFATCSVLNVLACDDDACGAAGPSRITFATQVNQWIFFRVGGWQGAQGTFDLNLSYASAPTLSSISPTSALMGNPSVLLDAFGTSFAFPPNGSTIRFNGVPQSTVFVSQTQLTTTLDLTGLAPGFFIVQIVTPGYAPTPALTFTILAPVPTISRVSPPLGVRGDPAMTTLTITGTGFVSGAAVTLAGQSLTVQSYTLSRIVATLQPSDLAVPGLKNVVVTNGSPGGGPGQPYPWRVVVPRTFEVLSASSQGAAANQDSRDPAVSMDSRFVVFSSRATNLDPADSNAFEDVFVRDRVLQTTTLVSRGTNGTIGNADSFGAAISADGRHIDFCSYASFSPAPPNPILQVWRRDRDTDGDGIFDEFGAVLTTLVSVGITAGGSNAPSHITSRGISGDGQRSVFTSAASNLVNGVTGGFDRVYVRDFVAGTTQVVSTGSSGLANASSYHASISGDGLWVVFTTTATNLFPPSGPTMLQVVRKDIVTGAIALVSRASGAGGAYGNGASQRPAISRDGRYVSFESLADNLGVPGADSNGVSDVYRRDMLSLTTELISFNRHGRAANAGSFLPTITPTGCTILATLATDLEASDTNSLPDVYAWRRTNNPTHLPLSMYNYPGGSVGSGASGIDPSGTPLGLDVSENADFVALGTRALNLAMSSSTFPTLGTTYVGGTVAPFVSVPTPGPDDNPVTFSVDGPVDPQTEGLLFARGAGPSTPFATRSPAAMPAQGQATSRPGDVRKYSSAVPFVLPSEAELFQSEPTGPMPPTATRPSGTNNQIVTAARAGLVAGFPISTYRDNIDAVSFGEDFFGVRGVSPSPVPVLRSWQLRTPSSVPEPIVTIDVGTSFRFSVDPWAIGLPLTAVREESLGYDVGPASWTSPGAAAGDVYATPVLEQPLPPPTGLNVVVHDQAMLGLSPPPVPPTAAREDDVDALECVGENDPSTWVLGAVGPEQPGNLHARAVESPGPELPTPLSPTHTIAEAPVFFSVDRQSTGAALTAVRTQWASGEAAGDVFMMLRRGGVDRNYLLIDETELGLYAPSVAGSAPCDDIDALVVNVFVDDRQRLLALLQTFPAPTLVGGNYVGVGYSQSIVSWVAQTNPSAPLRIRVGFSVSSDSIGLEGTAVDYEAGRKTRMEQAGDVFFTQFGTWPDAPLIGNTFPTSPYGTNWLWYQETSLGLDAGAWTWPLPSSPGLDLLPDELNALDTICTAPYFGGEMRTFDEGCPGSGGFRPILTPTGWPVAGRSVGAALHDCLGGSLAILVFGANTAVFTTPPFSSDCPLLIAPGAILTTIFTPLSGNGPGNGTAVHRLHLPAGLPGGAVVMQALVFDSGAANGIGCVSNGVTFEF